MADGTIGWIVAQAAAALTAILGVGSDGGEIRERRLATPCEDGTWNHDSNPATACVPWSVCEEGQVQRYPGTATRDRACMEALEGSQFGLPYGTLATVVALDRHGNRYIGLDDYVLQIGDQGDPVWIGETQGGDRDERRVAITKDGNVFVVGVAYTKEIFGRVTETDRLFGYVTKFDDQGDVLWTERFGLGYTDLRVSSIAVDGEGNLLIAGVSDALGLETLSAYVIKYGSDGEWHWIGKAGGNSHKDRVAVAAGDDGSVYVAECGDGNSYVHKYYSDGSVAWTADFGEESASAATSVAVGVNGQVVVAGVAFGSLDGSSGAVAERVNAFVRAYDADGNEVWTRQFEGDFDSAASSVAVASDGTVFVGGATYGNREGGAADEYDYDAFVLTYDMNGSLINSELFGSPEYDSVESLALDDEGHLTVAGFTAGDLFDTLTGLYDGFVVTF